MQFGIPRSDGAFPFLLNGEDAVLTANSVIAEFEITSAAEFVIFFLPQTTDTPHTYNFSFNTR